MAGISDHDNPDDRGRLLRPVRLGVIAVICAVCCVTVISFESSARVRSSEANSEDALSSGGATLESWQGDYSKFSHANAQHARLPCLLCHRRQDNSPQPVRSVGHSPCSGCHAKQFADSSNPICLICHANPSSKAVKAFPALSSFNAMFDHARHSNGAGRPSAGCTACHKPSRRGVALSIPDGVDAHTTCFQCHTNAAKSGGRDLSSCNTCHAVGRPQRTSEGARAYNVNFSHAEHSVKLPNCASCHTVKAGASRGRQVVSPVPLNHHAPTRGLSCMTCHNGRRAFGGDDFSDCTKCHSGNTWRF